MKEEILKLQEEEGDWSDPGNEQLINVFDNLNQIETQIRDMDQIADIYLNSLGMHWSSTLLYRFILWTFWQFPTTPYRIKEY